jgi:NADH:ubiquinone oxidoreductase subunit 6 (subunit J)
MSVTILWWGLAALTVLGAATVVLSRELTRIMLGLGAFLLGVAGLYAYLGFELLAVAEVFVYVGGVLVLFVFAITAIGRDTEGRAIARKFDLGALVVSAGFAGAIALALRSALPSAVPAAGVTVERTAAALLGPYLPQFEMVGVLLLAALAAALAIIAGGEDR